MQACIIFQSKEKRKNMKLYMINENREESIEIITTILKLLLKIASLLSNENNFSQQNSIPYLLDSFDL